MVNDTFLGAKRKDKMNAPRKLCSNIASALRAKTPNIAPVIRGKNGLFSRYLLVTNTVVSMFSSGVGDVLQQRYEIARGRQNSWNATRTRTISLTGAPIGVACHFWYIWLDKWLPGRTLRTVVKKIAVDQIIASPVGITLFLTTRGVLDKTPMQSVLSDIREKGWTLYVAEFFIWPPAQLFNFLFLPTRYRVVYDNAISLGFDCYYPYVTYRESQKKKKVIEQENKEDSSMRISSFIVEKKNIIESDDYLTCRKLNQASLSYNSLNDFLLWSSFSS